MSILEDTKLSNTVYTRIDKGVENAWDIPTLLTYVKEKKYSIFKLPIAGIPLSVLMFSITNMKEFAEHVKRVHNTSLDFPVLVDELGNICDGWHRVVKALLEGREYIDAIRIEEMPTPSSSKELD